MSILSALLRNTAVVGAGTGAAKALVFLATLVLTRLLGPEDFGRYTLAFAYLAFFELVADAGLDALAVRETARGEPGADRRLGDSLVLRALLIAIALPAALVLLPVVSDDPADLGLVALGGAALLTSPRRTSLARLFEIPFRARLDMTVPVRLAVASEALHLALLPVLVARAGVAGAVAAQAVASLPFAIALAVLSWRRLRPVLEPTRESLARRARAAAPLLAILLLNVVLVRIDVVMLRMMRGPLDVGLYGAPVRLVETANLLPILLMTSVYPLMARFAREDPDRCDRLFRGSLQALAAVLAPLVAAEILFAGPLLSLLFGADYADGRAALVPLALAEFLIFADVVVGHRLVAAGREGRNLAFVACAAATNVLANLVLIPARGIEGAALATLLAYAVRSAVALGPADTRLVGLGAVGALLPAVAAGAVAFGLPALLPVPAGVAFAIGVLVYVPALWAFGGLPDREEARRILRAVRERPAPGISPVAGSEGEVHNAGTSAPDRKDSA